MARRIKGKRSVFQVAPVTDALSAALPEWKGAQEGFKARRILAPDGQRIFLPASTKPTPVSFHLSQFAHYRSTLVARKMIAFGMVNPSALAVFMLTTSSNLVGFSNGRSFRFVPLRILSTCRAPRR